MIAPNTQNFFQPDRGSREITSSLPNVRCPRTWFVEALLVTLFCFFPFGFPAMWFASKVERAHSLGNYNEAENSSRKARLLVRWSVIIGAVLWFILLTLYLSGTMQPKFYITKYI